MVLLIYLTDTTLIFRYCDQSNSIRILRINTKHRLSELLWKRLPSFVGEQDISLIEAISFSYNPGTVRYSRLRSLCSIINTLGTLKGIPLYEHFTNTSIFPVLTKNEQRTLIHPQYSS